jgi:hypothetical protein
MKLACLPDRKRVRLALQITPALHQRLIAYADLYEKTYGRHEAIETLLPFIIESFLDSDRSFFRNAKAVDAPDQLP